MKKIETIGVVGAGTMGSALAQKFAQENFKVILADRAMTFVEKGLHRIRDTFDEAVQRKLFTDFQVNGFLNNIWGTARLSELAQCDLVIEAIYENFSAKSSLFAELSDILSADAIVATNTSSFSVNELSTFISNPQRFIGLHFFYHAAKNRLVEIIPGKSTSADIIEAIKLFAIKAGKDAIMCADQYGFAVNRFFVPWLNESARLLEEGAATKEEIDLVCMDAFGIGMGPFALMNATGVPVAYDSQKTLEVFGPLYWVSSALKKQSDSGKPWALKPMEEIKVDEKKAKLIRDRMYGIVFIVASAILDEKVCTAGDLEKGARIGLLWKRGPVGLMQTVGDDEVHRLVSAMAYRYGVKIPKTNQMSRLSTESVKLEVTGKRAVITFDQPQNMNALDVRVMEELAEKFKAVDEDPSVDTIILTGSGKAFVAGADIRFFVNNIKADRICDIESFTGFGHRVFDSIDKSSKKVVALLNGLTLGGGLELALCADLILAVPGVKMAFPETGIGIYPGLGGTQRSVNKIGKALSKYLIYTGKMINAREAEDIGLVDRVISMDEMFHILYHSAPLPEAMKNDLVPEWKRINDFFEQNSLEKLLQHQVSDHALNQEEAEKIIRTMNSKAPVALKLADRLIEERKGCDSELEHLREVFSTEDALLGLTSIGKKVAFSGK